MMPLWTRFRRRLSLAEDISNEAEIVEVLRRNVDFKGINLWTLIFAILVASIGLNVNSTAVIIGAMLISPLMGPIMGMGLAVAIFDFALLKRALFNLGVAVIFSVLTSFAYFSLSPLHDAQSELLARTTPTVWDVLIAITGGLAGIIAGSGRERGNAIPGVAIATALMPPLCTAGFGLATRNPTFFFGAFYLFIINAVMIGLSTTVVVRLLGFQRVSQPDEQRQRRVRLYMVIVVALTVLPSSYLGWRIVQKASFTAGAQRFVQEQLAFEGTYAIVKRVETWPERQVSVLIVGRAVPTARLDSARAHAKDYGLDGAQLHIEVGQTEDAVVDGSASRLTAVEGILKVREERIRTLEMELQTLRRPDYPIEQVQSEVKALFKDVESVRFGELIAGASQPAGLVAIVEAGKRIADKERERLAAWLSVRMGSTVTIVVR